MTLARVGQSILRRAQETVCTGGREIPQEKIGTSKGRESWVTKQQRPIHSTWAGDGEEKGCCVVTLLKILSSPYWRAGQHSEASAVSKPGFLSLLCSFLFSIMCAFIPDVYFDVSVLPHLTLVNHSVWSSCYVRVVMPSVNK